MLQYQTISTGTLGLLKSLMSKDVFNQMRLCGGTSLALQIGHRSSIDLDFFGELEIEQEELTSCLSDYKRVKSLKRS